MSLHTLENSNGLKMVVSSKGGIVMQIHTPDRDGTFADIALGFDTIEEYDEKSPYFGALIGRVGNRLAKGRFSIEGKGYEIAINNGPNSLHGGLVGFDKVEWSVEEISGDGYTGLKLHYLSKEGEEGFPGNLDTQVIYKLTDKNEWMIEYEATTDKTTVVNLTQHNYFNLGGHDSGDHLDHEAQLNARLMTPIDGGLIPTGEITSIEGTAFDFREFKAIGDDIESEEEQMKLGLGYDHNFVIDKLPGELAIAAIVRHPKTGRKLSVQTTEPGVQFYTGNFLDGSNVGKGGVVYERRSGFCLETQHFPDSPNHGHFPCITLAPGERYRSTTIYTFGVE